MTKEQEAILRDAFLQIELERLQPYRPDEEVTFSPEFEKRTEKLIRAQKRPYWRFTNTVGKRVAVAAVAVFVLLSATMSISAVREPVVDFVVEMWEDFVRVFVKEEAPRAPETIETVHIFKELPEGYVMVGQEKMNTRVETRWEKGNEWISLTQHTIFSPNHTLDNEEKQNTWMVEEYQIFHSVTEESDTYVWLTAQYFYTFNCSENFEKDVLAQMISELED